MAQVYYSVYTHESWLTDFILATEDKIAFDGKISRPSFKLHIALT